MKQKLKLIKYHGDLAPGVYTFSGKLIEHLLKSGKAIPVQEKKSVKQEKRQIETKEEKFIPETKDYSGVPISKLDVSVMSTQDLNVIAETDVRVTARKLAKEELKKR